MFTPRKKGSDVLVAEIEAVLSGTYLELLVADDRPVPPWAWTNALAHGTEEVLDALSMPSTQRGDARRAWWHARTYLAGEVLETGRRCGSLARLQSEVLIPFELGLVSGPQPRHPSPVDWVARITTALDDHLHRHPTPTDTP